MKECESPQPSRKTKTYISLLRGAAYAVLAFTALAAFLFRYPKPGLAYLTRLSSSAYDVSSSWVTGTSSRLKWFTCSDNPAFECAFLAVPINVRGSLEYVTRHTDELVVVPGFVEQPQSSLGVAKVSRRMQQKGP